MGKRKSKKVAKNNRYIPEILLFVGVFLVIISLTHNLLRARALRMDSQTVKAYLSDTQQSTTPNYPTHIKIPWYVDVDIEPEVYQEGSWTVSENQGSYLVGSAVPGQPGNMIIYGHNKREILGNIRALKGHETITLTLSDGTTKLYQVQSLTQVAANNTKLLTQTDTETLTIYTCAGILDSERFVVRAVPINE